MEIAIWLNNFRNYNLYNSSISIKIYIQITIERNNYFWNGCLISNHLLFVYQIALNEYNDDLIIPILEIISFDCIFLVINLIILDLITTKNLSAKKIFL